MTILIWHYVAHISAFLIALLIVIGIGVIPFTLIAGLGERLERHKRKTMKKD